MLQRFSDTRHRACSSHHSAGPKGRRKSAFNLVNLLRTHFASSKLGPEPTAVCTRAKPFTLVPTSSSSAHPPIESRAGLADAAPINCAGTVLSQPPIRTTASIGLCADHLLGVHRHQVSKLEARGIEKHLPSETVGNSTGKAPSINTPRFTASNSSGK